MMFIYNVMSNYHKYRPEKKMVLTADFLGATKDLYRRVCPSVHRSVGPLRLLIFDGIKVLWSTAWPVLALVQS